MNDRVYTLGVDPAKEKMTVCLLDGGGAPVAGPSDLPCTREGFDALLRMLGAHVPDGAELVVGIEASASLDDNLLCLFTSRRHPWKTRVIRADAAQVKGFSGPRPVRAKTDRADARRIAQFTRTYAGELALFAGDARLLAMQRLVNERLALADDLTAQKNRLRDRLVISFPELTQVFGDPCTGPALALLCIAPTARHAAAKRQTTLARAKASRRGSHAVGPERAAAIKALAQTSIASACTDSDAATIVRLAQRIAMLLDHKHQVEAQLAQFAASDPEQHGPGADVAHQIRIAASVPGIGMLAASAIVLRSCGVRRYTSAKAFAAQMGVCPERQQTGTSRDTARLTRRGDRRVRAIVFLCIMSACRADMATAFQWWRLKRAGLTPKQAYCACMNRLARVLWTLIKTNTPYDPERAVRNAQKHHPQLWETFLKSQPKLPKPSETTPAKTNTEALT
jgi:transposase